MKDLSHWAHIGGEVRRVGRLSVDEFAKSAGTPLVMRGEQATQELLAIERLREHAGAERVVVYVSRDGTFPGGRRPEHDEVHRGHEMSLAELLDRLTGHPGSPIIAEGEHYYLYQLPLKRLGPIASEIHPPAVIGPVSARVDSNLWIGECDNITPIHFDSSENILHQVGGKKLALLWEPSQYDRLYINPWGRPRDRQTMMDCLNSDTNAYPLFEDATALTVTLEPGDMLYIPACWFHYMKSLEMCVSLNHWWPFADNTRVISAMNKASTAVSEIGGMISERFDSRPELRGFWNRVVSEAAMF